MIRRISEIGCPACEGVMLGEGEIDIGVVEEGDIPGLVPMVPLHSREIRTFCSSEEHHEATVHFGGGQMWTTIKKRGEPDTRSAFEAMRR